MTENTSDIDLAMRVILAHQALIKTITTFAAADPQVIINPASPHWAVPDAAIIAKVYGQATFEGVRIFGCIDRKIESSREEWQNRPILAKDVRAMIDAAIAADRADRNRA